MKLLVLNGYPHDLTQKTEFKEMMQILQPDFQPIHRRTYIDGVREIFEKHQVEGVSRLFAEAKLHMNGVTKWMSMVHDLWKSINNNCIMGSSIKFATEDLFTHTIACFLLQHNTSHGAKDVADALQAKYMERYGIDLNNDAAFVGSDTTPCACNVADEIGCTQNDCEMHVIFLIVGYSIGRKEN